MLEKVFNELQCIHSHTETATDLMCEFDNGAEYHVIQNVMTAIYCTRG